MAIHIVSAGQDLWDVTTQQFGQVDNIKDVLDDNPNLTINTKIKSKDQITINKENKGNLKVKNFFQNINFVVMNADEATLASTTGDYNNDYNDDFFNT